MLINNIPWSDLIDEFKSLKTHNDFQQALFNYLNGFNSYSEFLIERITRNLFCDEFGISKKIIEQVINQAYYENSDLEHLAAKDCEAFFDRDPSVKYRFEPLIFSTGYIATQMYRVSHKIIENNYLFAKYIQKRVNELYAVDMHPACQIGEGFFLDHAIGFVIGETAQVGKNNSILQCVTLGGTGKEEGDRHPKVQDNVLIGAGAKILGNIKIGKNSKIGAGSVVLKNVEEYSTYVGVPAKKTRQLNSESNPGKEMNHL